MIRSDSIESHLTKLVGAFCLLVLLGAMTVAQKPLMADPAEGDAGKDILKGEQTVSAAEQLLSAAAEGRVEGVKQLIAEGVSAGVTDAEGRTPLHLAAGNGHRMTAEALLKSGADVNARDKAGRTALDAALAGGHSGAAGFLRSRGAVAGSFVRPKVAVSSAPSPEQKRKLLDAARQGRPDLVAPLVKAGVPINVTDADGRTVLHLAARAGHRGTVGNLLNMGAEVNARDHDGRTPLDFALANGHENTAELLRASGGTRGAEKAGTPSDASGGLFHPDAPFRSAETFAEAIGEPAVMLDSERVSMLVPKRREEAAAVVLPYLVRAYDELYKIVGVHTNYKMLVYAYPQGYPGVRGGTSGCVIKYTDENLDLEKHEEWTRYRVPHVAGYIEEMAHNFVHATGAEFGWEMVGWSISARVSDLVARNPIHQGAVARTRRVQEETYTRYRALGNRYPADLPADKADRIHAHLLRNCELQYGPSFWSDFFSEVRKERDALFGPSATSGSGGLNERYRITVECFDRLPGLNFKALLEENGISTTVAVQSLKPTAPGWNRKLK